MTAPTAPRSPTRSPACSTLLVLVGALLAACQTAGTAPPLSLEEAKRVTATFAGGRFVPPPRTVDDILAVLDQPRAERPQRRRLRETADARPPDSASPAQLAVFYLQRGKAAQNIGRVPQDVEDLRQASAYARQAPALAPEVMREVQNELGWAESRSGNYRRAVELMTESARIRDGWSVSSYAGLARMHAWAGDLTSARAALREAEGLVARGLGGVGGSVNVMGAQATLFGASGQYAEEERRLRQVVDKVGAPPFHPVTLENERMLLVSSLVRQDRLVEGEAEARDVVQAALSKTGKYSQLTARAVALLGAILYRQGRFIEAERLARVTVELHSRVDTEQASPPARASQVRLGVVLAGQEQWSEAVAQFEKSQILKVPRPLSFAATEFPLALVKVGRATDALPLIRLTIDGRTEQLGASHYVTAEARGVLAMGLAAMDDVTGALREFGAALRVLLGRAQPLAQEGDTRPARLWRLGLIVEAYLDLLSRLRGSPLERQMDLDVTAETFRMADSVRSRTVWRALGASAARAAAREPELAELVRRDQDTEQQIQALYGAVGTMLSMASDQQDPAVVQRLRTQLAQLTAAREVLAREIERSFPEYAALVAPQPVTLEETQTLLEPGEALVALYVGQDQTFVWAVPKTGAPVFAAVPLGRAATRKAVDALRRSLAPGGPTLGEVPEFDIETAHALYATLLEPVAAGWRGARRLVVVPHGALAEIPFAVLVTEPVALAPEGEVLFARYRRVPWLARRIALTHVPSVQSLKALRMAPHGRRDRKAFAGFGDPWFSQAQAREGSRLTEPGGLEFGGIGRPQGASLRLRAAPRLEGVSSAELARLPRLPDTADEVRSIAQVMGADQTRDVFLGTRANEDVVKRTTLEDRRVLVFATHGLLPGDLNGLLQPALALSAPEVAGVDGDGLLTMEEILGLRLDADWVVLSACNTAAGQGAGAEAVSGLGRAFFYAGTRALLVTHWPVETTSAQALVTDVFRRQAARPGLTRAEALREAMLGLMDGPGFVHPVSKRAVFSYAHPLFWAPFALVGDGG